LRSET